MLIDIWDVAPPAFELVSPYLRHGAIAVGDNTAIRPGNYREYFKFLR